MWQKIRIFRHSDRNYPKWNSHRKRNLRLKSISELSDNFKWPNVWVIRALRKRGRGRKIFSRNIFKTFPTFINLQIQEVQWNTAARNRKKITARSVITKLFKNGDKKGKTYKYPKIKDMYKTTNIRLKRIFLLEIIQGGTH